MIGDLKITDQIESILDLILGEEIGHLLHHHSNPDLYKYNLPDLDGSLIFIGELIGHYSGLIYCNRNNGSMIFGLGAEADGITGGAYKAADKLFKKHGDSKLLELTKINTLEVAFEGRI